MFSVLLNNHGTDIILYLERNAHQIQNRRVPSHNPVWRQLCHRSQLPLPPRPWDEPQLRLASPQRRHPGQRSQRGFPELVRLRYPAALIPKI